MVHQLIQNYQYFQLHKIGKSGVSLGRLPGPLLKSCLPLMKNVLRPLTKSVLIPLGLTIAASATGAAIQKKFWIKDDQTDGLKWSNE